MRQLAPSKRDGSKRWELRVDVGRDPDKVQRAPETGRVVRQGPPIHVSRVFHGGKRAAIKALDQLVAAEGQARTVGANATVGKLLTDYLANMERLGRAQSTLETYRRHIEKHLRGGLGSIRIDRLTTHDIERYLADLERNKALAPRTIMLNHAILTAALNNAVAWKWMQSNPATVAQLKPADSTAVTVSTKQLGALYQAALADDPDVAVVIALAALTGCRRGNSAASNGRTSTQSGRL